MRLIKHSIFFLALATYPLAARSIPAGGGDNAEAVVAPEPTTWLLMGTGIGGIFVSAALRARKRK